MSMYMLDGAPMTSDPRHALGGPGGGARRPRACFPPRRSSWNSSFSPMTAAGWRHPPGGRCRRWPLLHPDRGLCGRSAFTGCCRLFSAVYAGAELAGIKAETLISEYAPGQYELTLHYRDDPLTAADDLIRLKTHRPGAGAAHGVTPVSWHKPIADYADRGCTCMSRCATRRAKRVRLKPKGRAGTRRFCTRWAGSIHHGRIHAGLCPPRQFLAPVCQPELRARLAQLGGSTPVRRAAHPRGRPRRAADRTSAGGVDANPTSSRQPCWPHPAWADPPDRPRARNHRNAYAEAAAPAIPVDWRTAILAAQGSDFLKGALGADMHRTFTAIKAAEYARVARTVSEVDYDLYLIGSDGQVPLKAHPTGPGAGGVHTPESGPRVCSPNGLPDGYSGCRSARYGRRVRFQRTLSPARIIRSGRTGRSAICPSATARPPG